MNFVLNTKRLEGFSMRQNLALILSKTFSKSSLQYIILKFVQAR